MLEITQLDGDARRAQACDALPFARLDQGNGAYLAAWLDGMPIGHVHVARTTPPELQDLFVLAAHRGAGVGTALLREGEALCRSASHREVCLAVSVDSTETRSLYESLGYADVGIPPRRVVGTIQLRSGPLVVDDTLLTLVKQLEDD